MPKYADMVVFGGPSMIGVQARVCPCAKIMSSVLGM